MEEDSVSLQDYIASVPAASLPRVIQIASGVYLQSSVYDIKGSECCLSTGDLVKVLEKELKFISCVDLNIGKCFELPSNFKDIFQIVVNSGTYNSLKDLKQKLYGDLTHPFWFASAADIILEDRIIYQQRPIKYVSPDNFNPTSVAICQVCEVHNEACIKIPTRTVGQFYECVNTESYTLEHILKSPALLKRSYSCSSLGNGPYKLTPVYEIKTIMHMRKDIVKMPSSLEVEVKDITDQCRDTEFIKPYSLAEVSQCEEKFPVVTEIVESSDCSHIVKNYLSSSLGKGQKIIIHRKALSRKVLATAAKGKLSRFFYIHTGYEGKARQRPREFTTVYDLWTQLIAGVKLNVVVTQDCDSIEDCFPSLCIGDHLKVLRHEKIRASDNLDYKETDVLVCGKDSADDDDDESEEIMLPLYLEGRFVEEIKDNKKYTISNIMQKFTLPCEVKVVTKDPSFPSDPLPSFASIRLEEIIEEPVLLASFLDKPFVCFQIPIKWRDFSLIFLKDPVPETQTMFTPLEELTEWYYYNLRKELPSKELPPPRPPKRQAKAESSNKPGRENKPTCKNSKPDQLHSLSSGKRTTEPYRSPTMNAYSPLPRKSTSHDDLEPNYEVEKMFASNLKITD